MDENTWRMLQVMMWAMGIQTTLIISAIGFVWNNLGKRMDKLEAKVDNIDKRLIAVETILHMKECCRISPDEVKKVA